MLSVSGGCSNLSPQCNVESSAGVGVGASLVLDVNDKEGMEGGGAEEGGVGRR